VHAHVDWRRGSPQRPDPRYLAGSGIVVRIDVIVVNFAFALTPAELADVGTLLVGLLQLAVRRQMLFLFVIVDVLIEPVFDQAEIYQCLLLHVTDVNHLQC
jgi:hypothetical protein